VKNSTFEYRQMDEMSLDWILGSYEVSNGEMSAESRAKLAR
jgi:hypothetical protein